MNAGMRQAQDNQGRRVVRAPVGLMVALALQILAVAVIAFGDIGFDKPGRFGLDFGDFLLLLGVWLGASCFGLVRAWLSRRRSLFVLQCCVIALVLVGSYATLYLPGPSPDFPVYERRMPGGK